MTQGRVFVALIAAITIIAIPSFLWPPFIFIWAFGILGVLFLIVLWNLAAIISDMAQHR